MAIKNRFCWFLIAILALLPSVTFAVNIDPYNEGSHYVWGENVGWLDLSPGGNSGPGVEVGSLYLTGFIWGENIGWISLSCLNSGNCPTANFGVVNDGAGNLSGDAWGENVGWINFDRVIINPTTGIFSGFAWGENIGWINFAPAGRTIKTSWLNPEACTDSDGDGYALQGGSCGPADCNDSSYIEHPNQIWYKDTDNDGYSDGTINTTSCTRPPGYKAATELISTFGDCNDNNASINPGAAEVCDTVDNNCDGQIDEGLTTTYYQDADGDGYGNPVVSIQACTQPSGYVLDNSDCNDNDENERPKQTWYKDEDNDGYSDGTQMTSCSRPVGYKVVSELASTSGDCNDKNAAINVVQGTCGIIDPESNDSQYAWGENVGWINFAPSQGPGVNVTNMGLFGYAWGENIGWVNLSPTNGGVINDGAGNLSGYAWGENVGWINFAPTGGGVFINPTDGVFSGHAWGENIGWINLGPTSGGVKTSWRSSAPVPVAYNQPVTTDEDSQIRITLTGSDPGSNPLTFAVVGGPFHGLLSGSPPNLTYLPNSNYFGADSFTFRVNNGTLNSNTAIVSITITPVNDAPTANDQSLSSDQGTALAIALTASDVDGDALSFIIVSQPSNGSLSGVAPNLTYSPNASFSGADSFNFKVNDGQVDSNIATVIIAVNPVTAQYTVQTSPTGLSIAVDGTWYTSPQAFQWTPGSTYIIETTSPQDSAGTRYLWSNWSDGGAISHSVTAPASPITYTATFDTYYLVTMGVSPFGAGSISANPSSADGYFNSGSVVEFTATPNAGCQFANWSGDLTGTANPQTLSMSAPRSVTANFNCTPEYIFYGFFTPVDNPPVVNEAKAGQAIPVKWRLTDKNGIPIDDPASFSSLTSYRVSCDSLEGDPTEGVEEYASGSSGLQYSGDGYWQFNWKTPKTFASQCRMMIVVFEDGSTKSAKFKFK
jgi:hypothetical protein